MSAVSIDERARAELEQRDGIGPQDYERAPIESYESDARPTARASAIETAEAPEIIAALEISRRVTDWAPRDSSGLLNVPELPKAILSGLILPGTVAVAPGEGGGGKTTLFTRMAMSIAAGIEFLGFECDLPGTSVLLLAEDDQKRADYVLTKLLLAEREQMAREGWTASAIEEFTSDVRQRVRLISVRGVGATLASPEFGTFRVSASVDALCRSLEKISDLRIVGFDTLSRFAGVSLDSNDSAPIVLTALERIAERTGAHVIATHHTGKSVAREKNEDQYSARGASAITDNARLVLRLRPLDKEEAAEAGLVASDEQTYLRLIVAKSNYFVRPEPITICRRGYLFRLATVAANAVGEIYRGHLRALADVIRSLESQGVRPSKAALEDQKQLGGRNQVRRMIEQCTAQGWIETQGKGPASRLALSADGRAVLGEVSRQPEAARSGA